MKQTEQNARDAATLEKEEGPARSFMDYDLGYIGLEEKTLQPLDNPFGPRL